mgnify:FL=1
MKSLLQLLSLLLLTLLFPAHADQTDPGLDELFTRLQLTTDSRQLQFIEASIWE